MKIKEFAETTQLSIQTIRYYDKIGLLIPNKSDNKYRIFSHDDVDDVLIIKSLKMSGMSLQDIAVILGLKRREISVLCKEDTLKFINKYHENLEKQIKVLEKVNDSFDTIITLIQSEATYDEDKLLGMLSQLLSGDNES